MRLARHLILLAALGAVPVLALSTAAAEQTWTRPILPGTAAWFWLIITAPFLVGYVALRATRLAADKSFSIAAWSLFAFTNWHLIRMAILRGLEVRALRPVHMAIGLLLLTGFVVWAGIRVDGAGKIITIVTVAFFGVQLFSLVGAMSKLIEPDPANPTPNAVIAESTPSVWVIILDAHPSPSALRSFYEVDLTNALLDLQALGFRVWDDARANYTHTTASVPSLLNGAMYQGTLDENMPAMLAGLQGATPLTASFVAAGYQLRMSPAPWSRSECGPSVSVCFDEGHDERLHFLLRITPLSDLFPERFGHPMPIGGRDVLLSVKRYATSPRHFTFVHSTVSHLPFVLSSDCAVRVSEDTGLEDQLRCSQTLLADVVRGIDLKTDIVIVAADHGEGLYGQADLTPSEWTPEMANERFAVFLAISDPSNCASTLPDQVTLAEVLPRVLNCHGNSIAVPTPRFVGMEQGHWGRIVEYDFPWDGWADAFNS